MISYRIPVGVKSLTSQEGIILSTAPGGRIKTDRALHTIWQEADGKSIDEIVDRCSSKTFPREQVLLALACLTEADLLSRHDDRQSKNNGVRRESLITAGSGDAATISVIIVCHNSRLWLEKCLPSIFAQTYPPVEIIVVDNGSTDGSADWLAGSFPSVKQMGISPSQSLARALNLGIETARGDYYLILNPDVEMEPDSLAAMLEIARENSSCAAVAPKLRFSWAPAFLNGLGNFVGAFSWGSDCALGHLDLGQFDAWREVPSACFAATLIPSVVYRRVGPIDEGFPLYYEDSDWSYRARLLGYTILAAPKAVVYHAFGGQRLDADQVGMAQAKLHQVSYGRLRFATKILGGKFLLRFLSGYFIEDLFRVVFALLQGNWGNIHATSQAWNDYLRSLPALIRIRHDIQMHRKCSDEVLLDLQRNTPRPFVRRGMPCLTWNIIWSCYAPSFISGEAKEIPEISRTNFRAFVESTDKRTLSGLCSTLQVWRSEGFQGLLYWIGKTVQWYLMRP